MAYAIQEFTQIGKGPTSEWYELHHAVRPGLGNSDPTDVMLIQFLLAQFFTTPFVTQREVFIPLFLNATKGGKRWDDGIYGPNTREGVRLFELATFAPYKDGIIRPIPWPGIYSSDYAVLPKLGKLNWVFDRALSSDIEEKHRIIRLVANPILAARLLDESGE